MMKQIITAFFIFIAFNSVFSQSIKNVRAEQEGNRIVIYYNLVDPGGRAESFDVSVYCSTNGGSTWGSPLQKVTGDVGSKVKAGYGKEISWDVLAEREKLTGEHICFEVRARKAYDLGIEMVFVKGGTFTMGCTSE